MSNYREGMDFSKMGVKEDTPMTGEGQLDLGGLYMGRDHSNVLATLSNLVKDGEYPLMLEFNVGTLGGLPMMLFTPEILSRFITEFDVNTDFHAEVTNFMVVVSLLDGFYGCRNTLELVIDSINALFNTVDGTNNTTEFYKGREREANVLTSRLDLNMGVILQDRDRYTHVFAYFLYSTILHLIKFRPAEEVNEQSN